MHTYVVGVYNGRWCWPIAQTCVDYDVIEQWNQMPPDFCSRLFESVPRRITAII